MESTIDAQDRVNLLIANGYGELVTVLLDPTMYTHNKERLIKRRVCERLGWHHSQLQEALMACREVLGNQY